jgi:hypothetical protein
LPLLRRKRIRRIVLGVTLLAIIAAVWRFGPVGWRHAQLLYWQRQCMSYTRPQETPAWEIDAAKAAALITSNPDYVSAPWTSGGPPLATHLPKCLREFQRLVGSSRNSNPPPILLVHELRTPSGNRRLVVVSGSGHSFLTATVYAPAGAWSAPRQVGQGHYANPALTSGALFIAPSNDGTGQLAQPDPADPSRFTVPLIYQGGITAFRAIEGRLTDDDQIVFKEISVR